MSKRNSIIAIGLIVLIGILVIPQHTHGAQFIIAGWDYPDEYGQGIRNVAIEQYTNGAWVSLTGGGEGYYDSSNTFEITNGEGSNGSLSLAVQCYLNATLCGISDINDGPALIRHTITISTALNASVFYQENFTLTYQTDAYDPLYFYQYTVITDFTPNYGTTYTAIITYEVAY